MTNVAGCPSETELLAAIEGQLTGEAERRVNRHLPECERCRELIEKLAKRPAAGSDPLLGTMLGEYLVEERIGQGGMGVVYRARHPLIGKQVAVKLLRGSMSTDQTAVQRLITEAQAVNAIGHRGIIDIFSFGQLKDGRRYFVMEYLNGTALNDYLRACGKLSPYQALLLLDDIVSALAAAHGAGIIHRDLKPSNLFLVQQPDGSRFVKVLDFGLSRPARLKDENAKGLLLGTPFYMAPELIKGGEIGTWTDLYALGVMAWQMLAGQRPFEGGSSIAIMRKQVDMPAPGLAQHAPATPAPLLSLVMSMLEKDPKKRPQSTSNVRQEVKRMLHALSNEKTAIGPPLESEVPPSRSKVPAVTRPEAGRLPHPSTALPKAEPFTEPVVPVVAGPIPDLPDDVSTVEARMTSPELNAPDEDEDHDPEPPTEVPLEPPPKPGWMDRLRRMLKGK